MDLFTYFTPIAAFLGIILSIISILYTQHQNKRRIDVNIEYDDSGYYTFEEPCDITIELSAFNSGFRSVAIINYELLVNGKVIHFTYENSYKDPTKNVNIIIGPECDNKLPHALKEGEISVAIIKAGDLAKVLRNKIIDRRRLKGEVELSGYFETGDKKKHFCKDPIKFNIDKWKMC